MIFHLDHVNKIPVYVQLKGQVLHALSRGLLKFGDQLPTVREVAVSLTINPNTVNRAYAELERDGVLMTRRGRGTFVTDGVRRNDAVAQQARLDDMSRRVLGEAKAFGFRSSDLIKAVARIAREDRR
ncbi:MAG: GntR family transcriptional regulator [Candidatus Eremiobacteraeota bacterium]|nr:GntR family transcriptional regulator [Candidatus Eremiobacteraeota bacterium]